MIDFKKYIAPTLSLLLAAPLARAFVQEESGGEAAPEEEAQAEKEEEEDDSEARWFAVVGGDVYPGPGGVLRGATVLARNGVIKEIGYELFVPEEAEVLDATGYRVYPGLIAIASFGLFGGASDIENTVDPFSRNMVLGLASGITTAVQSGQAAKLKRGEIEGVVLASNVLAPVSFTVRNPSAKREWRDKFASAAEYLRKYRRWEEDVKKDKELKEPSDKGVDKTVVRVLKGEVLAQFDADERTDLVEIARLAQQYGFRPVVDGCGEGWTVAEELGRARAFAIVTPRYRRTKDENLVREGGSSIENAALLYRAGVQLAIVPGSRGIDLGGIVGRDIMHLPIEAGFAVRGGLPERAALDAITIGPARIIGLDHRIGSLEVGKDCDLIVTDGDVLHYQTFVQWAVVDGKQVYDKEKELYFAHIRPRPEPALAPETKLDAGENPPEEAAEREGDDG